MIVKSARQIALLDDLIVCERRRNAARVPQFAVKPNDG